MIKFQELFSKGGLSLDRLRNFALIAEAGGLSLAAGGDPTRMSLFSKQVKELEGFFGVALTRRQGRKVKLTEAGQRLARLAHAHLSGLEDFQQTCKGVPQTLSLGSANSLIEWLVVPQVAKLRRSLPNTLFEFYDGRTEGLVRQLTDMSLDLALVREDAVVRPLKFKRLLLLTYSLFVPKRMAASIREDNLKAAMAGLALATSIGGQYREQLTTAAAKARWPLRIELSCSSFTQAARAVKTGAFGAALPNLAAAAFTPGEVVQFALPFLKSYARPICVAWNPRLVDVRPLVERAIGVLRQALGGGGGSPS
jgi:DNA-binding transcriptional LysR family regulator